MFKKKTGCHWYKQYDGLATEESTNLFWTNTDKNF